jgi:hypothetical protein
MHHLSVDLLVVPKAGARYIVWIPPEATCTAKGDRKLVSRVLVNDALSTSYTSALMNSLEKT